jgi:hypothetical protein
VPLSKFSVALDKVDAAPVGLMTDRLRKHLTAINLYEGETSNSSRRGCSITLRMLGVADKEISNHIGWHSKNMINHYANIGNILSPAGAASTLSNATESLDKGTSKLNQVSNCFLNVNKEICKSVLISYT